MDYEAALTYLDRHIGRGMKPGLDRISGLLEFMGHPEEGYPIIHIAGTNGKTSTGRMATLLLVAHGLTTGTFTSPHLERSEERLSVNGRDSTPDEFAQAVTDVAAFADLFEEKQGDSLTYFELTAAAAFAFFADQAVNAAVIEVGLGGRLDATNAVNGKVTVITGIDFDHTETLGATLGLIAQEKLGIVKPASILITGRLPTEAAVEAEKVARTLGVEHRRHHSDFEVARAERAVGGWLCDIRGAEAEYEEIYLPLHGRHQADNLAVAIASVEALLGRTLDTEAVRQGSAAITVPGRMEPIGHGPLVLLDGAHNPQGFQVLGAALSEEFGTLSWVLVLAAMVDKDLEGMVSHLAGRVTKVVATEVESARALPAADLAERAAQLLGVAAEPVSEPAEAIERAKALAGSDQGVLCTGSLYLVGAVRSHLLGHGPTQRGER